MARATHGWGPDPQAAQMRVLFVDDDPLMRRAIGRQLSAHGVELVGVAFQTHVEPLLASGPYDAVLCDYHLGDGTSTPLVRRLVVEHRKVAVLTSDPEGARADVGLAGIQVLAKFDLEEVLAWLRQPVDEPPDKPSHERLKAAPLAAEPWRPSVAKLAIEAPAVPRSATPVELAAYEEMELPDPRDAQMDPAGARHVESDSPTRQMPSAPRLRAATPPPTSTPSDSRPRALPSWLVFVMGVGVGGGGVAFTLWLIGTLGLG